MELLVSRGHNSEKGPQARVPLNYKLWLLPRDFVILESSNQQVKRGVTILAYMADPEKDEEVGLLSHSVAREGYPWNLSSPLGTLLLLSVKRHMQQPKSGKSYQGFRPLRN